MIIRFRSKDGMVRVKVEQTDPFSKALNEVAAKYSIKDPESVFVSDKPNERGTNATDLADRSVEDLNLKNGDIIFLTYESSESQASSEGPGAGRDQQTVPVRDTTPAPKAVKQHPVDDLLDKEEGLIKRSKSNLCNHGDRGMCEYCSPLPPWDKNYLKEQGIKHKSFHAYLKEMNEQQNNSSKASSYIAPLQDLNYAINLRCPGGHAPYPGGICSKCQPAPITLQQQPFRMVDHVEYADHSILNTFIDVWRQSGVQRYGVLYGRYEPFQKVPLGIKAVVEAIYEPPQSGEFDGITLLPWENEADVDKVAQALGLQKVGVVFTDLTDSGRRDGSVLCKRHKESYFLSCVEVMMAAKNQVAHPNYSKYSETQDFSSKFVTCVITGNLNGEIEPHSYQVSRSAEGLVKADIISASTHPNMLCINKTQGSRYVPDVFYSKINEYGLEVKENAKPAFPVEFLLVTLSDSFPLEPKPMFKQQFVVENREFLGELQDLKAVQRQIQQGDEDGSHLVDFHFLVYLCKMGVLSGEELDLLLKFAKEKNYDDYLHLIQSGGWMTLLTILEQSTH
ncbi:hypothetical protein CJJ07_003218 [Candidozyma auris]|nr:hypothetical protein CJJ07_003218 [[Candida] auris]QEL59493.1 hypothetical protein CJJ09_001573 [[Candida] auris]